MTQDTTRESDKSLKYNILYYQFSNVQTQWCFPLSRSNSHVQIDLLNLLYLVSDDFFLIINVI